MTLDPEQLRRTMRAWTTGVTVVTAIYEGKQYGMTVNSFTSISLEPPLISVALRKMTHTHDLVEKSGEFSITILSTDHFLDIPAHDLSVIQIPVELNI